VAFDDPRLRELDPRPSPLPGSLVRAREGLARSAALFLSIPESALGREWRWIGEGEGDVRTGFYVAIQAFEGAAGQIRRSLGSRASADGPGAGAVSPATEARWDLHGLLAPLADEILDADPGRGEWTVRLTLAHILASQRAYAVFNAWWMSRRDEADFPPSIPEALAEKMEAKLPSKGEVAAGSLARARSRLDGLVDLSSELWRQASEDELRVPARWMGFPVTTGFRVGRWSTHIQEHTIQVEKTLALLGREPNEIGRMVRLIYRAFGRMEGAMWADGAIEGGEEAAIDAAVTEVEGIASGIAQAARAG